MKKKHNYNFESNKQNKCKLASSFNFFVLYFFSGYLCYIGRLGSAGDPDPQDPHVFGTPDPDPLVSGMYPDPSLFS